jgi:transcription termination/antitermination protein NusG
MSHNELIHNWYVLHTRSRFENVVRDALAKKSLDVYLPKVRVRSKRRDRKLLIQVPLFPGYVFVRTDLNPYEHIEILKTAGAVRLIGNNDGPVHVEHNTIDSLKVMVEGPSPVTTGIKFKRGDRVIVVSGPLTGVIGVFYRYRGTDRIVVQIQALGQFAAVEVDSDDIEPLPASYV